MSTLNPTALSDSVYIHAQTAHRDVQVKAEVAAIGRIQLYIGPWLVSLSQEDAEEVLDVLSVAVAQGIVAKADAAITAVKKAALEVVK